MSANNFNIKGLTHEQVLDTGKGHRNNQLAFKKESEFF